MSEIRFRGIDQHTVLTEPPMIGDLLVATKTDVLTALEEARTEGYAAGLDAAREEVAAHVAIRLDGYGRWTDDPPTILAAIDALRTRP